VSSREKRASVDTCVLVNIMTAGGVDDADWLEWSLSVVEAAERGDYRLTISALVIAELAGTPAIRGSHIEPRLRHQRVTAVRNFFSSAGYLVVDLDQRTAMRASELATKHQLFGPDAIVLASALAANSFVLYTWDHDLLKLNGEFDMPILKPSEQPGGTQLSLAYGNDTAGAFDVG
jgi:predicted nucleic acid-binding protein